MSAPQKLRGGSESELTKLKALWRTLAEVSQDYWREQFISQRTQADIRREILAKLKINLRRDGQLNDFRKWLRDQDARDAQAERMQENERRLTEEHPDWSLDQVREKVIKESYLESLATGDFKLGLATVKQDLNVQKVSIDKRKLVLLENKAAQADAAKGILENKELSEEQKRSRMREVFGLA